MADIQKNSWGGVVNIKFKPMSGLIWPVIRIMRMQENIGTKLTI